MPRKSKKAAIEQGIAEKRARINPMAASMGAAAENLAAHRRAQGGGRGTLVDADGRTSVEAGSRAVEYRFLKHQNECYDQELWQELRGLYAGGPALLRNKALMKRLFPPHRAELEEIYRERVARAFYFPYAGTIIDRLLAGLTADPIAVNGEAAGEDETELPTWWAEWLADTSPEGGLKQPIRQLAIEIMRECLVTKWTWVLIDRPAKPDDVQFSSRLEQEQSPYSRPYAVILQAEHVIDWEIDDDGQIEWLMICDTARRRSADLTDTRDLVTETYTQFTRDEWRRWRVTYHPDRPPEDKELVAQLDGGVHGLGRVPVERVELPDGLWAMGKLESLAREHMNKRCAVAWAEYKGLFAVLYEFLGPEETFTPGGFTANEQATDPDRALNQVYGVGHSQIRGKEDKAAYVGPDVAPFAEGRQSCQEIMREMHRVTSVMASSVEMNSAAMRRSGESKERDQDDTGIVLRALGQILRDAVDRVVALVKALRADETPLVVQGAEEFDGAAVGESITEAVELLNGVPLRSHTFVVEYLYRLYKIALGSANTSEETLAAIREEIRQAVTAESLAGDDSISLGDGKRGRPGEDEDDDEQEEEPGADG